ncbi:MAG TPA: hypothetical protein VGR26_00035 [Acidimicrobiales bacterium]|nr:hypothetical protein [Acidimicrobiales bacterium]
MALAACGSDDDQSAADLTTSTTAEETTTTTAPPETTTAAPTPEDQVLAAYQGYWAAVNEAFGPPQVRPDLPALRQYATGEVLAGIVRRAEEVKGRDSVTRLRENGQYVHRAEVLSVDGATATVRDCNIDDVVEENAATGGAIDDGVSTRLYISMLVLEDRHWKVAVLEREMAWEGVAGCALE